LNLSWLTSITVPLNGLGKDLVTDVLSQPTNREHVCEGRENNFCQLHISWLALLRLSAEVRGIEGPGANSFQTHTPGKKIPPIAYFMANSDMGLAIDTDLPSTCLKLDRKVGSDGTLLRTGRNFLAISYFMTAFL
jgi:hypothetical protein